MDSQAGRKHQSGLRYISQQRSWTHKRISSKHKCEWQQKVLYHIEIHRKAFALQEPEVRHPLFHYDVFHRRKSARLLVRRGILQNKLSRVHSEKRVQQICASHQRRCVEEARWLR